MFHVLNFRFQPLNHVCENRISRCLEVILIRKFHTHYCQFFFVCFKHLRVPLFDLDNTSCIIIVSILNSIKNSFKKFDCKNYFNTQDSNYSFTQCCFIVFKKRCFLCNSIKNLLFVSLQILSSASKFQNSFSNII